MAVSVEGPSGHTDPTCAGELTWLDSEPSRRMDARVQWIVRRLREHSLDARSTSLPRLAEMVRLSPSRFMHLFTESVGVPLRSYVLRLKLRRAVEGLALGHNVTVAAHLAGFADAAHLTRTSRRILGMTPRELVRRLAGLSALRLPFPFAGSPNLGVPTHDPQVKPESRAPTAADSFKTGLVDGRYDRLKTSDGHGNLSDGIRFECSSSRGARGRSAHARRARRLA
jgi:AraC-like DNA-binding protein